MVALYSYTWNFRTKAAAYEIYENKKHTKYSGFTVHVQITDFMIFAPGLSFELSKLSDYFTPFLFFFFSTSKDHNKVPGQNFKIWSWDQICGHAFNEQVSQVSCRCSQRFQTSFNSRERELIRARWSILCKKPIQLQVDNFGGTFDRLFLWLFLCGFHTRCLSTSIQLCKKVKKWPKT